MAHRYSASDFCGKGPGLKSVISHNDPEVRQDYVFCNNVLVENLRVERETYLRGKKDLNSFLFIKKSKNHVPR